MISAVPHRLDRGLELLDHRNHDGLDVGVVLLDDLEDVETTDAREVDVEEHQIDVLFSHHQEAGLAGRRPKHPVIPPQHGGQRLAHPLVVVNDEDGFLPIGHAGREYSAAP